MKCQNNQKLSEVLWVMTTSSWIIQNCSVFIFFSPQISSQTQSRQSSLFRRGRQHQVQRPDPCREQQPDGETLRDLRLAGAVAALVSCLVSVRELWSVCMMVSLLCVCIRLRVRTFTSLNSTGIQLSLCRLCGVLCRFLPSTRCPFPLSFTWVHSACGGVIRYGFNAQGEMRD